MCCSASPSSDGGRPSFEAIVERVAWWAEVFEIPCVGYAASYDEIGAACRRRRGFRGVGRFHLDRCARRCRGHRRCRRASDAAGGGRMISHSPLEADRARRNCGRAHRCRSTRASGDRPARQVRSGRSRRAREPDIAYGAYPARPLYHRLYRGQEARRREGRSQGNDAAGRTLCRRSRRSARRSNRRRNGTSAPPSAATAKRCSRSRCSG